MQRGGSFVQGWVLYMGLCRIRIGKILYTLLVNVIQRSNVTLLRCIQRWSVLTVWSGCIVPVYSPKYNMEPVQCTQLLTSLLSPPALYTPT